MNKIKVSSFDEIVEKIKNDKNFTDLYDCADKIHRDVFDLKFSKAIGENESELEPIRNRIRIKKIAFARSLKTRFDCKGLEMSHMNIFNKIIMPVTKTKKN